MNPRNAPCLPGQVQRLVRSLALSQSAFAFRSPSFPVATPIAPEQHRPCGPEPEPVFVARHRSNFTPQRGERLEIDARRLTQILEPQYCVAGIGVLVDQGKFHESQSKGLGSCFALWWGGSPEEAAVLNHQIPDRSPLLFGRTLEGTEDLE